MEVVTFIEKLKQWQGTPFKLGGRIKGYGCDCINFPLAVLEEMGESSGLPDVQGYKRLGKYSSNKIIDQMLSINWILGNKPFEVADIVVIRRALRYLQIIVLISVENKTIEVISSWNPGGVAIKRWKISWIDKHEHLIFRKTK